MSYALLALGLIAGMGGYVIAGRVGALGLLRLGGEGEMSDTTMVRNSGESAAPSLPRKLFMVGRLGGKRPLDALALLPLRVRAGTVQA